MTKFSYQNICSCFIPNILNLSHIIMCAVFLKSYLQAIINNNFELIQMRDNDSFTESMAQSFAEKVSSSYMMSSRTSVMYNEQGYDAAKEIAEFRIQIQKRYMLSVANKYYSFPFTELSFDSPFDDQQLNQLIGRDTICLHEMVHPKVIQSKKDNNDERENSSKKKSIDVNSLLKQIQADRQKFSEILQIINNRKTTQHQEKYSKSKQKRLPYKYGVIKEQDEQILRKRLYTQPNQKATGFIIKKK